MKAYNFATKDKFGSLTTDFSAKDDKYQFRKNLNELIIIE